MLILSRNVFSPLLLFDYAGVVFVIFVLILQYHYEMQYFMLLCTCCSSKMLIYQNGQKY